MEQPQPVQQAGWQAPYPPSAPRFPGATVPTATPVGVGMPAGLEGLNLWLIVPILGVTVLWCGVAGLPFNAVALVFAIIARTKYDRGDLDRARKHLRRAKIFGVVGLVLALANIVVGITAAVMSEQSSG